MMTALRLDKTGACYGIFPDAPLMEVPDPVREFGYIMPSSFLHSTKTYKKSWVLGRTDAVAILNLSCSRAFC